LKVSVFYLRSLGDFSFSPKNRHTLRIPWDRLDKGREGLVEAVNLKHDQVADLLSQMGIFPAFHMNKRYWISLPLDDTLTDEKVLELFERSWFLTSKK